MLKFSSDYMQCAHPNIINRISMENENMFSGYGADEICESAKNRIKKACKNNDIKIHFLVGGTQANAVSLDALLGKCGGIISAKTGHIAVHEAGAIEATGHKVIELEGTADGRLKAQTIEAFMHSFTNDETAPHMVQPEVVYISQSTEHGAIYSKEQLLQIRKVCDKYNLRLYIDGARLGYALMADGADVDLEFLTKTCDVFTIGGTKVGALFGEAVIFCKPELEKGFVTLCKRRGALLAKGFLLGIQFDELFKDNLYFKISVHAIECADKLREALRQKNYELFCENPTNQVFVVFDNDKFEEISKNATLQVWLPSENGKTIVRIATSWATKKDDITSFLALI